MRSLEAFSGLTHGAAEVPAAGDVERDLEAELLGDAKGVEVESGPLGGTELGAGGDVGVAVLIRAVGVYEEDAAVAFALHLGEVAGDGFFGGVAVEPPPVAAEARGGGRIEEAAGNGVLDCGGGARCGGGGADCAWCGRARGPREVARQRGRDAGGGWARAWSWEEFVFLSIFYPRHKLEQVGR